jgi:hypothetical protein
MLPPPTVRVCSTVSVEPPLHPKVEPSHKLAPPTIPALKSRLRDIRWRMTSIQYLL